MKKFGLVLLMLLLALRLPAPTYNFKYDPGWFSVKYLNDFLTDIKSTETWHDSIAYKKGNPWKAVNRIGALGAFQFMPKTLRWLGYTGSIKYFLNNKDIQIKYMIKLIEFNKSVLKRNSYTYKVNVSDSIGKTINGIQLTWSAVLAASHLSGAGGVQRWVARKGNAKDMNGTTVAMYLQKFNNYNMEVNPRSKEAYELMHNGILALSRAEMQGIRVDMDYVESTLNHLNRKAARIERQFKETDFFKEWQKTSRTPINIYSGQQLSKFLYKVKGIEPKKFTPKSTENDVIGSVDADALKQLNMPELSFYEDRKNIKKSIDVLSGFAKEQVDGYIHPFFNLHIARTFRSSMSNPNMQNIPIRNKEVMKICRNALFPRPGHQILESDFSGIEVRVSACYNQDEKLIYDILHGDMHGDMAKEIFKLDKLDKSIDGHKTLRQAAKNGFVFPQFYGDYYKNNAKSMALEWGQLPEGRWRSRQGIVIDQIGKPFKDLYLSDQLISKGIKSYDQFIDHVQDIEDSFWNKRYTAYRDWKDSHWSVYKKYGYFDLKTGFRCSGAMSYNDASNYPVQGAAFHCLLWSLTRLDEIIRKENLDSRIINQIHDSIVIDVNPKELKYITKVVKKITTEELAEHWKWLTIPMEIEMDICEVDKSWATKSKYDA